MVKMELANEHPPVRSRLTFGSFHIVKVYSTETFKHMTNRGVEKLQNNLVIVIKKRDASGCVSLKMAV